MKIRALTVDTEQKRAEAEAPAAAGTPSCGAPVRERSDSKLNCWRVGIRCVPLLPCRLSHDDCVRASIRRYDCDKNLKLSGLLCFTSQFGVDVCFCSVAFFCHERWRQGRSRRIFFFFAFRQSMACAWRDINAVAVSRRLPDKQWWVRTVVDMANESLAWSLLRACFTRETCRLLHGTTAEPALQPIGIPRTPLMHPVTIHLQGLTATRERGDLLAPHDPPHGNPVRAHLRFTNLFFFTQPSILRNSFDTLHLYSSEGFSCKHVGMTGGARFVLIFMAFVIFFLRATSRSSARGAKILRTP